VECFFVAVDDTDFLTAKPFSNFKNMSHILQIMAALLAGLRLEKSMTALALATSSCRFFVTYIGHNTRPLATTYRPQPWIKGGNYLNNSPLLARPLENRNLAILGLYH